MKKLKIYTLNCLILTVLFLNLAQAQDDYFPGRLHFKIWDTSVVKLPDYDASYQGNFPYLQQIIDNYGVTKIYKPYGFMENVSDSNIYEINFSTEYDVEDIIDELEILFFTEYIKKVAKVYFHFLPDDSLYSRQWYLEDLKADTVWGITKGDSNIVIAVIDNAILMTHEDIKNKIVLPYDAADNDNNTNPPTDFTNFEWNHGTHVAGIAGAQTNNNIGVSSIGYNLKIMPIKTVKDSSSGPKQTDLPTVTKAIKYAIDNKAEIISMSFGTSTMFDSISYRTLKQAYDSGIVIVASSGNDGSAKINYPAGYSFVISVGAINRFDVIAEYSNRGNNINLDILAPGTGILSTMANSDSAYGYMSGTSMACPMVASICGLVLSQYPGILPDSVESLIKQTGIDINYRNPLYYGQLGAKRISPLRALTLNTDTIIAQFVTGDSTQFGCVGRQMKFIAKPYQNYTYTWDYGDGTVHVNTPNNIDTHTYVNSGIYSVKLFVNQGVFQFDSVCLSNYIVIKDCDSVIKSDRNNWVFGKKSHINFSEGYAKCKLDVFNNVPDMNSLRPTVCQNDTNGNLIFYGYSNGTGSDEGYIRNSHHDTITNGYFKNTDFEFTSSSNFGISIPHPYDSNLYYIFFTNEPYIGSTTDRQFRYCVYNKSGDSLEVIMKGIGGPQGASHVYDYDKDNNIVDSAVAVAPGIIAIPAIPKCNYSYWIIVHGNSKDTIPYRNRFYIYKLDESGLFIDHVDTSIGIMDEYVFRATSDGSKIVLVDSFMYKDENVAKPIVYNFNRETGKISNPCELNRGNRGFCFSPNSNLLFAYDTRNGSIIQFDLSQGNPNLTSKEFSTDVVIYSMQLGPDSTLYLNPHEKKYLKAIIYPDRVISEDNSNEFGYIDFSTLLVGNKSQTIHSGWFFPTFIDAFYPEDSDIPVDYTYTFSNCNRIDFCAPIYRNVTYNWYVNGVKEDSTSNKFTIRCCDFPVSYVVTLVIPGVGAMIKTIEADTLPNLDIIAEMHDCDQNKFDKFTAVINYDHNKLDFNWSVGDDGTIIENQDSIIYVDWDSNYHFVNLTVTDLETGCTQSISKEYYYDQTCAIGYTFDSSNSQNPFPAFVPPPYCEPIYVFGGKIYVKDYADLSLNQQILIKECTEIIVDSTSKLSIDNNNRTYTCESWTGITLTGNSTQNQLNLNNTTIKNAKVGVYSNGSTFVTIDSTLFENNRRDIVLNGTGQGNFEMTQSTISKTIYDTNTCTSRSRNFVPSRKALVYVDDFDIARVHDTRFINEIEADSDYYAIYINSPSTFDVTRDSFWGQYDKIVFINSGTPGVQSYISQNLIEAKAETGIELKNCSYFEISRNEAISDVDSMFRLTGCSNFLFATNEIEYAGNDTSTTGIYVKCSSGNFLDNKIKGFTNGMEYYDSTTMLNSSIEMSLFDSNKFGLVVSRALHPYYDSNSNQPDLINLEIKCNKFLRNEIGIFGSGEMITQGEPNEDAANRFDTSMNWYMLWQNANPVQYYYHQSYNAFTNPNFKTGSAYLMNGVMQSASDVIANGISPGITCFNTWIFIDYNALDIESEDVLSKNGIIVYPNPFTNSLTIQADKKIDQVIVFDVFGKIIIEKQFTSNRFSIPTDNWSKGIYLIRLTDNSGNNHVFKLFKTK